MSAVVITKHEEVHTSALVQIIVSYQIRAFMQTTTQVCVTISRDLQSLFTSHKFTDDMASG